MRMRRKKNLEARLTAVSEYIIETDRSFLNVKLAVENKDYLCYEQIFGNANPVSLEIGCGKGGFICKTAKVSPEKNFLAVEMMQNIIVMAGEKAKSMGVENLKFINTGAEYLPRYIRPESLDTIYLNFSPPFPQKSYECRRLTNERNVKNYYDFLVKGGCVVQKTDDKEFFEYSYSQLAKIGFKVIDTTDALATDEKNIHTEYEEKFKKLGMKIYRLVAEK